MAIEIIDKLKPKNSRGFKLVDAIDVEMANNNSVEKEFELTNKKISKLEETKLEIFSLDPYITKDEIKSELKIINSNISGLNDYYSNLQTTVDGMLSGVAFDNINLTNYYNINYIDNLELALKRLIDSKIAAVDINGDISNFLTDYYTKIEIDRRLANLNLDNHYDKVEIDNKFDTVYNKSYIDSNFVTKSTYELNKSNTDSSISNLRNSIQSLENIVRDLTNNDNFDNYYNKTQIDQKLINKVDMDKIDEVTTNINNVKKMVENLNYVDSTIYTIDKQTLNSQISQLDSNISYLSTEMRNTVKREELNSSIEELREQINLIPGGVDVTNLTQKIISLEASVNQNTTNVSLKANRNEVYTIDAINTKFTDVNMIISDIQNSLIDITDSLENKVNKTTHINDINGINSQISNLLLELESMNNLVDTKVNKTTYDTDIQNIRDIISTFEGVEDNSLLINRVNLLETEMINTKENLDSKVNNADYEDDKQQQDECLDNLKNEVNQIHVDISTKLAISDLTSDVIASQINSGDDKINYKNLNLESKITLNDLSPEVKILLDEIKFLRERIEALENS